MDLDFFTSAEKPMEIYVRGCVQAAKRWAAGEICSLGPKDPKLGTAYQVRQCRYQHEELLRWPNRRFLAHLEPLHLPLAGARKLSLFPFGPKGHDVAGATAQDADLSACDGPEMLGCGLRAGEKDHTHGLHDVCRTRPSEQRACWRDKPLDKTG